MKNLANIPHALASVLKPMSDRYDFQVGHGHSVSVTLRHEDKNACITLPWILSDEISERASRLSEMVLDTLSGLVQPFAVCPLGQIDDSVQTISRLVNDTCPRITYSASADRELFIAETHGGDFQIGYPRETMYPLMKQGGCIGLIRMIQPYFVEKE